MDKQSEWAAAAGTEAALAHRRFEGSAFNPFAVARRLGGLVGAALGKGAFCNLERLRLRNRFRMMNNTLIIVPAGHEALANPCIF